MTLAMKLISGISVVFIFIIMFQTGTSIVCPKSYCKNVTCDVNVTDVKYCKENEHLASTFCGCCHYCQKDLPEFASCINLGGLTIPTNTVCGKGLVCCRGQTCLKPRDCNCIKTPICEDWTLCERVRCAGVTTCPKGQYLVWDNCGCCQYCSDKPKVGICGSCEDIHCKEPYPICKEGQIVSIDSCGCCKVCKDVLGEGESCSLTGFSFSVCDRELRCIDGICKKLE